MKILFIGSGNIPSTFIKRRLFALSEEGIIVLNPEENTTTFVNLINLVISKPNRIYYFLKIINLQNKKSFKSKIITAVKYIDLIKKKPDIIHFQWINHVQSFEWLINYFKVPVVASVRGSMVTIYPHNDSDYTRSLQKSFELCDYVHCVSKSLERICIQDFNVKCNKVFTNYNGIDTSKFTQKKEKDISDKILRLVSTGGLMWRKGHLFQLLVLKKLENYPVHLTIIGDGEDRFKLEYQIKKLRLVEKVTLLGNITELEVISELHNADVYISTSIAEGLSNSVMEAASCGLPVVAFNCEGMNEIIKQEETGFIVPFGDIQCMADNIQFFINKNEKIIEFGENARNHILQNYSIDYHVNDMIEYYNKIIT